MNPLDQKVALVTGGGSGIGEATAELFAKQGMSVLVVDIDDAAGQAVANRIGAEYCTADVSNPEHVAMAFGRCEEVFGGVDVAFLNAGIATQIDDLTKLDDALYRRIMGVNVDGVVYGIRAAVPAMKRRGGGAIVATASMAGFTPYSPDPLFAATKLAVVGLIRSVAPLLEYHEITANTVNPGIVDTNIMTEETKYRLTQSGVRIMSASDVAQSVLRVVSGGGTGECWICDGTGDDRVYDFREMASPMATSPGT